LLLQFLSVIFLGLEKLASLHANAIRVLGIQQKLLMGLSTKTQITHVGFLQHADLIQQCPASVRTQAIRVLAGRCALAARVDGQGECGKWGCDCCVLTCCLNKVAGKASVATVGITYRDEVQAKIEHLVAPPPPRQIKALPVPRTGDGKVVQRGGEQAG
jgi:U4/U6 small nuclear ribonucleoprotein PRP31